MKFTSEAARDRADEAGLFEEDFDGFAPSGAHDAYTAADVKAVIAARETSSPEGFSEVDWSGVTLFQCDACSFNHTDKSTMKHHIAHKHPEGA